MTDINFDDLAKSVGKAIGRQRQQAGLTQDQVAEVSAPRSAPVFRTIRSSHLTSSFLHRGFSYDYATT